MSEHRCDRCGCAKQVKELEAKLARKDARIAKVTKENEELHQLADYYRNQLDKAVNLAPGSGRVN